MKYKLNLFAASHISSKTVSKLEIVSGHFTYLDDDEISKTMNSKSYDSLNFVIDSNIENFKNLLPLFTVLTVKVFKEQWIPADYVSFHTLLKLKDFLSKNEHNTSYQDAIIPVAFLL